MAYTAIDPQTSECYGICLADPCYIKEACKEVIRWQKQGAIIRLLPFDEANDLFDGKKKCVTVQEGKEILSKLLGCKRVEETREAKVKVAQQKSFQQLSQDFRQAVFNLKKACLNKQSY